MPRPKFPLKAAGGGGPHFPLALKSIRFSRQGCANRPFYHITVMMARRHQHDQPIEQLGTYDPLPNKFNERLVSMNIDRLKYWLAHRTVLSKPVARLFGLSGLLPIHPTVYQLAWERRFVAQELEKQGKLNVKAADDAENLTKDIEES